MKKDPPAPVIDRPPPLTLREQLIEGPHWFTGEIAFCIACIELTSLDKATTLCKPCWRAWRWSPVRSRGGGMEPASDSPSAGGVAGLGTEIPSLRPSPGDAPPPRKEG